MVLQKCPAEHRPLSPSVSWIRDEVFEKQGWVTTTCTATATTHEVSIGSVPSISQAHCKGSHHRSSPQLCVEEVVLTLPLFFLNKGTETSGSPETCPGPPIRSRIQTQVPTTPTFGSLNYHASLSSLSLKSPHLALADFTKRSWGERLPQMLS